MGKKLGKKAWIIIGAAVLVAVAVTVTLLLMDDGKPYSKYDLSEYITVGEYTGLPVDGFTIAVTDEEINTRIQENLTAAGTTNTVEEGIVADGETVIIDFAGKVDGKVFDGGSATDQSLTIGSGSFIEGFESGLIGVEVGKAVDLNLTFPADYSSTDLAGKAVVFTVTVKSRQILVIPTLDDTFVKSNSDVNTVAEYTAFIKEELTTEKTDAAILAQKQKLWGTIVIASEVIKYPDKEVQAVIDSTVEEYKGYAEQYEMEYVEFLQQYVGVENEADFNTQVAEYAKVLVKEEMILYTIAGKEDLNTTNDEYEQFIKDTLEDYDYTEESFKETQGKTYEDAVGKDTIMRQLYLDKVQDFILSKAVVTPAK
jgi:trigger factor